LSSAIIEYFNKHVDFVKENEKKRIIFAIIAKIRNSGGRFLKLSKERQAFYEIDAEAAEIKVSRALNYRKHRDSQSHSSKNREARSKGRADKNTRPKKTINATASPHSPLPKEDVIFETTFQDKEASKRHDSASNRQMQLGAAKDVQMPSELQSLHVKKLIEERQRDCLQPLCYRNISSELIQAYKEIGSLQENINKYKDRKIKLQQKIKRILQESQPLTVRHDNSLINYHGKTGHELHPSAKNTLRKSNDYNLGNSSSEESSDEEDIFYQIDRTVNGFSQVTGNYVLTAYGT
jgi:hypothetical protein